MQTVKIAVIVGSLRKDSINRRLARAIARLAPEGIAFEEVSIAELPVYNQDDDGHEVSAVLQFRAAVQAADAVLFVTPEHNRSLPAALKNALDQGSRPAGQNVWAWKPAAIVGLSPGSTGTAMMQQHLRNILSFFNMPVLRQPEMYLQLREDFFTPDGAISEHSFAYVQKFVHQFLAFIEQHRD